jgi:hypothetical protein
MSGAGPDRTRNFEAYGHAQSKKTQKLILRSALRPNQISFSHSLGHKPPPSPVLACLLSPGADMVRRSPLVRPRPQRPSGSIARRAQRRAPWRCFVGDKSKRAAIPAEMPEEGLLQAAFPPRCLRETGLWRDLVNARLKLPENQRFEIAMAVQPARSFEYPRCSSPAGFHRRSLGGKRGPGGSPLSRPQPPEAVAEGQSLQGTVTRPRSVTEGDDRVCMWRQV